MASTSSFIVADKVTVYSRRAGEAASQGVRWECDMQDEGSGQFTVEVIEKVTRGTEIILHLRDDATEGAGNLLSGHQLRTLIRKYSDHILQPIVMKKESWDEEAKAQKITAEDETVNQATALWARSKGSIEDQEYIEFYKHVSHDYAEPLTWGHARVEGRSEYTQLLYIPSHAPSTCSTATRAMA